MSEQERVEQRRRATAGLSEALAATTGTAEHQTGLAVATTTATGVLTALRLHPAALARGPEAVGRIVEETARRATEFAVQRAYNTIAKTLGDGVTLAVENLVGSTPARAAGWDTVRTVLPDGSPFTPPPPAEPPAEVAPPPQPAPQQRPEPVRRRPAPPPDDDEDAFFADPFRAQKYR
ncbi:hypothetical protein [Umezawaea beigongshangensis]|uniref:hypothetical protein n=1 Tax=Umezawaea beigongshangensis TaxID=2780383 RepID=UPI0018F1FE6D|nr:hypothetical protein [Umezawaea beigongshangensis]